MAFVASRWTINANADEVSELYDPGRHPLIASRRYKDFGAQGRNRTTDTVIFSHVLYQLSYLGAGRESGGL